MSKGQCLLSFLERAFVVSVVMAVLSRVAVIWPKNMLHDARMAGLAKLRRSIRSTDERQLRAGCDWQPDPRKAGLSRRRKTASSPKRMLIWAIQTAASRHARAMCLVRLTQPWPNPLRER
jgi:hypothetical protein